MTEPLTTRGPFRDGDVTTVQWALQSGQVQEENGPRVIIRAGVQLFVPVAGRIAEADLPDVNAVDALIAALQEHRDNIAPHVVHPPNVVPLIDVNRDALRREANVPLKPLPIIRAANSVRAQWKWADVDGRLAVDQLNANLAMALDNLTAAIEAAPPVDRQAAHEDQAMDRAGIFTGLRNLADVWTDAQKDRGRRMVRGHWPELADAVDALTPNVNRGE